MSDISLGRLSDFKDGDHRVFAVGDLQFGVFRIGDAVAAFRNRCPHDGGPVCQGKVINRVEETLNANQESTGLQFGKERHVVCPWHGYEFSLDTGLHPGSKTLRLARVDVYVENDEIFLRQP